jgi:Methyltransferase domain
VWKKTLDELVLLPRAHQFAAIEKLWTTYASSDYEQWNTAFGSQSLYDAWARLPFMRSLYSHNRSLIRQTLPGRSDWHVVEIGGGNGALWQDLLTTLHPGTLTLIDPNVDAHVAVTSRLPKQVAFRALNYDVERVEIPDADVIVCSLTLHHVAGMDKAQRRAFGLDGEGKKEILQRVVAAIRSRQGIAILNEADCYNEIDLASGDPVLVDHFIDVYIRRAARGIAVALEESGADAELLRAWELILKHWCIDQIALALAPRDQRDVYELDAAHWLGLLADVGARGISHRYTDTLHLFQQYTFH